MLITILALEVPRLLRAGPLSTAYVATNLLLLLLLTIPMATRRRRVVSAAMTTFCAVMFLIYFREMAIAQQFNQLFGTGHG